MSWEIYIQNMVQEKGPLQAAAICGTTDGSEAVWACSPDLSGITCDEIKKLMKNRGDFQIHGCHLGGQKLRLLRDQMEDDQIHSMDLKTSSSNKGGAVNVCISKCKTAIVIGVGKEGCSGGQVSCEVSKTADHLIKSGM